MRTTVTLEPDVSDLLERLMRERKLTFKEALNFAVRAALSPSPQTGFSTPTFSMGKPTVPLDKALQLAAELEDEEIIRKLAAGR